MMARTPGGRAYADRAAQFNDAFARSCHPSRTSEHSWVTAKRRDRVRMFGAREEIPHVSSTHFRAWKTPEYRH
jgi:hypothetical protein